MWSGEYKGAKTEVEGNDVSLVNRFEKEVMRKSLTSKFALVVYGQVAKETSDLNNLKLLENLGKYEGRPNLKVVY